MRPAIRIAPPSVISRVYPTSRASLRIRPITAVANPGGDGTGGGKLADAAPQGVELADRGPAVDAVSLVVCELATVAVGDLLEQGVDISTRQGCLRSADD
jgi:hypothetical protein